jgi:diguanylate cyclase (GGDEF)-like protein/PAS domain S-box-containing protein
MAAEALADPAVRFGPSPIAPGEIPFGQEFFRRLFDNLYDGVYFVDKTRRILFWNTGAQRLTGYAPEEVLGSYCYANILNHTDEEGNELCVDGCPLLATVTTGIPASKRVFLRHKDGRRIAVDVHVMPLRNDAGDVIGGVEIFRDASSFVALEHAYGRLHELAEKDPLTGVANRRHLDAMLDHQVGLLRRTGIPFSVIMADIDHFKEINDTWGHPVGDKALVSVAEQMQQTCRASDCIGRWGGDEFMVVLPEQLLLDAAVLADRLRLAIAAKTPGELEGRGVTTSFGVAEAMFGDTVAKLIERVDAALYRAKSEGRNCVETTDRSPVDGAASQTQDA